MTIAVTTPTGNVGHHVVHHLLLAGVRPTLLLRDAARLTEELRDGCDVVELDQADEHAVVAATRGVEALFWVNPPTMVPDPVAAYARFGAVAARAVRENRIGRTVLLSSVGAEQRHGAGEIDGLARVEELLDEVVGQGRSVLHLRCGFFFTNLLMDLDSLRAGVVPVVVPVDRPMPWVAPRDIAMVAALRLLSADWSGRQVQAVHGPEDLSWAAAMHTVSRVSGRQVRAEQIPDGAMRQLLAGSGMPPGLVEAVLGMSTGLRDDFVPEQQRDLTTTTPTTLEAWAVEELVPALGD